MKKLLELFIGKNKWKKSRSLGKNVKTELGLPNYATKADLKNATGFDTSDFAKKIDLAYLKFEVDKLIWMVSNFFYQKTSGGGNKKKLCKMKNWLKNYTTQLLENLRKEKCTHLL